MFDLMRFYRLVYSDRKQISLQRPLFDSALTNDDCSGNQVSGFFRVGLVLIRMVMEGCETSKSFVLR